MSPRSGPATSRRTGSTSTEGGGRTREAAAGTNRPAAALFLWGVDLVSERPELLQRNGSRFALSGVRVSHAGGELRALLAEEDETRGDEYDTQRADDDGSDRSLQGCGE